MSLTIIQSMILTDQYYPFITLVIPICNKDVLMIVIGMMTQSIGYQRLVMNKQ
jgi:hypothetical protein